MRSRVSFQVERIVEPLSADRAEVSLDVAVTLDVTIEQSPDGELLSADATHELVVVCLQSQVLSVDQFTTNLTKQGVLDPVTAVDRFRRPNGRCLRVKTRKTIFSYYYI